MRVTMTILTGLMMVLTAQSELVTALRPAIREAAAKNGVDPVLMEAIIRHESANATSSAARRKNNLAGIMGRRGQRRYASKEACVQDLAELLAKYRAKGRVTVVQISRAYCSDSKHWVSRISSTMSAIRKGKWGQYE
ncbi:MAG: glucosaminidase domain-containing protein [Akkermansia sp.]|nr:glucosaminidase domain-containing protein [Akkermansia sp.]